MAFSPDDIRANREYFAAKLRAEKQKVDVAAKVKKEPNAGDFLLLDVRTRDAFAAGHIAGALSVPVADIPKLAPKLGQGRSAVRRDGVPVQGDERRLGRVAGGAAPHARGGAGGRREVRGVRVTERACAGGVRPAS